MNIVDKHARIVSVTVYCIITVALLIVLERLLSPRLLALGDMFFALACFIVIAAKTIVPLVLLKRVCGLGPASLGWVKGGLWQAVWKGIVLAICMLAFAIVYQKYGALFFGYKATGTSSLSQVTAPLALGLLLTGSLLNAFGEEIIFRGMLLPVLTKRTGIIVALLLHSFIFTVYHLFPIQNSILLFIMGIFFALGYLWSGSLLTPLIAHLIENGLGVIIFLFGKL